LLLWGEDDYAIWYKQLEASCVRFPASQYDVPPVEIHSADRVTLLARIDRVRPANSLSSRWPHKTDAESGTCHKDRRKHPGESKDGNPMDSRDPVVLNLDGRNGPSAPSLVMGRAVVAQRTLGYDSSPRSSSAWKLPYRAINY